MYYQWSGSEGKMEEEQENVGSNEQKRKSWCKTRRQWIWCPGRRNTYPEAHGGQICIAKSVKDQDLEVAEAKQGVKQPEYVRHTRSELCMCREARRKEQRGMHTLIKSMGPSQDVCWKRVHRVQDVQSAVLKCRMSVSRQIRCTGS